MLSGILFLRNRLGISARFAVVAGMLALAACSQPPRTNDRVASAESAVLGTQWGEGVASSVTSVSLKRKSATPLAVSEIRYSAAPVQGEVVRAVPLADGRVTMRVLQENGRPWPITRSGNALHLQGREGARYTLEFRNLSKTETFEIVATVDGLDVLNGQAGSLRNRGYVLGAGETVGIEGYRKSRSEVAAFRFSDAAESYAARNAAGSVRNLGVIGAAVFELQPPPPFRGAPPPASCGAGGPCAFPASAAGPN